MSDLISRSELLKAMNTWDKFGYDCHRGLVRIDKHTEGPYYYTYFLYKDKEYCDKSERVYHVAKNKEGKKVKVHAVLLYWDNKSDETKPYDIKIQDFLE